MAKIVPVRAGELDSYQQSRAAVELSEAVTQKPMWQLLGRRCLWQARNNLADTEVAARTVGRMVAVELAGGHATTLAVDSDSNRYVGVGASIKLPRRQLWLPMPAIPTKLVKAMPWLIASQTEPAGPHLSAWIDRRRPDAAQETSEMFAAMRDEAAAQGTNAWTFEPSRTIKHGVHEAIEAAGLLPVDWRVPIDTLEPNWHIVPDGIVYESPMPDTDAA